LTESVLLAFCTCPDRAVANRIADALVRERLAACVNQIPGLTSVFEWEGKIEHDSEVLLLIKTPESRFDSLAERLRALHPYELPELIATPITRGLPEYLKWVHQCASDET
jgi:periplasmic divalent cation tolerance protein